MSSTARKPQNGYRPMKPSLPPKPPAKPPMKKTISEPLFDASTSVPSRTKSVGHSHSIDTSSSPAGRSTTVPTRTKSVGHSHSIDASGSPVSRPTTVPTRTKSVGHSHSIDASGSPASTAVPSKTRSISHSQFIDASGSPASTTVPSRTRSVGHSHSIDTSSSPASTTVPTRTKSVGHSHSIDASGSPVSTTVPTRTRSVCYDHISDASTADSSTTITTRLVRSRTVDHGQFGSQSPDIPPILPPPPRTTSTSSTGSSSPQRGTPPKIPMPLPSKAIAAARVGHSPTKLGSVSEETKGWKKKPLPPLPPLPPPKNTRRPSDYLMFVPISYKLPVSSTELPVSSTDTTDGTTSSKSTASESSPLVSPSSTMSPSAPRPQPVTYTRPPPREIEYTEREHPRNAFEYLDQMRQRGDLCDVTLIVNEKKIQAHKVVLSSCSQYFEQMFIGEFAEPDDQPIVIDEVEEDALVALVDFTYTSRIKLTDRNVYSLFEAADLLQFPGVKGACFKFFKQQINKSNCIRTWLFAESHNCTELLDAAVKYIECNFLDIVRGREFLSLDHADVVARLVALEDLAITSEEQVYEAVLGWLQHDPEERREHAPEVFKSVRFPSISRDYLMHIVDNEPFIKEDPDCLQQLIDALEIHVSSIRSTMRRKLKKQGSSSYSNMQPRPASMAVEVVEILRENRILGLRIMGGDDRPYHVFRQGDKPGIFILKVTADGAAARVGKLRSGDRILKVNETDMSKVTHEQAIRLLTTSQDPLVLLVRHEPPPPGLQEMTLVTKPGEGFGFAICGGVNGFPGNPLDETDEGIFISQIIPGGAAEQDGRLLVGMRLLQVNSVSMLGKTHEGVLQVLQGVLDRINLLICHGYDPDAVPNTIDTVDEFGYVGSETLYEPTFLDNTRSDSGASR